LAEIAASDGSSAQRARDLFKKALTWGQDGVDFEEQAEALELLQQWTAPGKPVKYLCCVLDGLKQLLAMEATNVGPHEDGTSISMWRARLKLTDDLRRLRTAALEVAFSLARSAEAATRREAAKVSHNAMSEIMQAMGPEEREAVLPSPEDPATPVRVPYKVPQVNTADDLTAQLRDLFGRVETEAKQESEPTVLLEWESCVDWHARFAPETDLGKEAVRIIGAMRTRPGHRLACVLLGRMRDPQDEKELEAVVDEALKTRTVDELFAIVRDSAHLSGNGSSGRFLFRLTTRDPAYGRALLDLCGKVGDEPALPPHPLGMLVSALHVTGADRTVARTFADRGGPWRRVAAAAVSRLRPEWYAGFTLTSDDLALIRELALDTDPVVWEPIADFAPSLAHHDPGACLSLAREIAAGHEESALEKVAEMCRELLDRDATTYRVPIVDLVNQSFVAAPRIDGYWTARLLVRLSAGHLDWLIDFFDARIRTAESRDASIHEFRVVPNVIEQLLPKAAEASDQIAAAVLRVLGWSLSTGRRAYEAASLLRKLVGKHVTPVLVAALQQVVSTSGAPVELASPASSVLRAFADDDAKFAALFLLLDAIDKSSSAKRLDAVRALVNSVGGGSVTAAMGKTPPVYLQLLERLRRFDAAHLGHSAVQSFVELAVKVVESRIQWHREQDEEFRIRVS
jgi:hypothetical protein